MDDAQHRASTLLETLRATPMRRGPATAAQRAVEDRVAEAIAVPGVAPRLARRVAYQLVMKCDVTGQSERTTWRAIGVQLARETDRLRTGLGLVDRQIVVALPKLAPPDIEQLLATLQRREPSVARTILNAALDASVPREMAERYLEEYRRVVESLAHLEPELARTLANATFMARRPTQKARRHLQQFERLVTTFGDTGAPIRTLAREACRAPRPQAAGQWFLTDRRAVIALV